MSNWWQERPLRLVQTNLREIDLQRDPREIVRQTKAFSANAILFNVAGIVSYYPTKLEFQTPSPLLRGDFVGEAVQEAHALGMRFIARFDLSKCHRHVYERHPEWFFLQADGQPQIFNGLYSTCVNGGYYREYAFVVLKEVLERYDVDGCFFNMFGNHPRDYSGRDHGLCRCANCQRRFQEIFGYPLPATADANDHAHLDYLIFQDTCTNEMAQAVGDFIHTTKPNTAFFTYTLHHTDIVRSESNSAVDRPLPFWQYSASDNVKRVLGAYPGKVVSNAAVYFVDIPYRFTGVSPHLTALRLAQNITQGAGPDFYVLGSLQQEDRSGLAAAQAMFEFAAANEAELHGLISLAKTLLLFPERSHRLGKSILDAYRGMFRILTENHILFDCAHDFVLDEDGADAFLAKYDTLVLPGAACLSDRQIAAIDAFVQNGGRVLVTGVTGLYDLQGRSRATPGLASLGVAAVNHVGTNMRSAYIRMGSAGGLALAETGLLFVDGAYIYTTLRDGARGEMKLLPPSSYGPPEKCFNDVIETDLPGCIRYSYGAGASAYFPWLVDQLYYKHSTPGHAQVVMSVLLDLCGGQRQVETNAHELVEIAFFAHPAGHFVLNLANSSGGQSTAFFAPAPMTGLTFKLRLPRTVTSARSLLGKRDLPLWRDGALTCVALDRLDLHETIILN